MKVFAILFCLVITEEYSQSNECELKRDKDGVKVYTCKPESTRFKSLKAEFTLENISIEGLEAFLFDVKNYPTWQYNMVEAKVLSKSNEHDMIYRSLIDAPWPLEDRELIVRFQAVNTKTEGLFFSIQNVQHDYPATEGIIRVPYMNATWNITKAANNKLNVVYTLNIDPGGSVPAWLVNIAMADGPHHSFRSLREQIIKQSSIK